MGIITKAMMFQLDYREGAGNYSNALHELWELQKMTREILNRSIQEACLWDYRSRQHRKETGVPLSFLETEGCKRLDSYLYKVIAPDFSVMHSDSLNAVIQKAYKKYSDKDFQKQVFLGEISIPSYKKDQPILFVPDTPKKRRNMRFSRSPEYGNTVEISPFSGKYKKEKGYDDLLFTIRTDDDTQKAILSRILDGKYKAGVSQLIYQAVKINQKKTKRWFLLLTYSFEAKENILDPNKILGIDMGTAYAVYCSTFGSRGTFKIEGTEVKEYAAKLEARRHSKQAQARYCGEGRIGHGTKTRVEPVYQAGDSLANYRDTINHRYSKAVIDYAVKTGCGVIQMEDLQGIKKDTGYPKYLQHWTYYDLQSKIEYKAKEQGIEVVKVNPRYTSQRCSHCGWIDSASRPEQATFRCTKCGFERNADYNASQNISIRGIEEIIEKQRKAQNLCEPEEDSES